MKKVFISIMICSIANIIFAQTSFNNVTTITPSSLPQLNGNIYHKDNDECLLYGHDHKDLKEEDILRYHVVLEEKLLKNDLHNGMHRETMLGFSYLLGFFLHDDQVRSFL